MHLLGGYIVVHDDLPLLHSVCGGSWRVEPLRSGRGTLVAATASAAVVFTTC